MEIQYPTNEEIEDMFDSIECELRDDEILIIDAPQTFICVDAL